ncbi:MAG: 4Fe-4S dicluster domain-containing protein [Desulfatiglandales bacterium]
MEAGQPLEITEQGNRFLSQIEGETGINLGACYQCERCTNSCPVAEFMDIKPHQVIRSVQLGQRSRLLGSRTIWVCLSCEMCSAHCPNEVGVAEVIIHLRNLAARSPYPAHEKELELFYRKFMGELTRFGRINEIWLMTSMNMSPSVLIKKVKDGSFLPELKLGLELVKRGRLHFWPKKSKAAKELRRLQEKLKGR